MYFHIIVLLHDNTFYLKAQYNVTAIIVVFVIILSYKMTYFLWKFEILPGG